MGRIEASEELEFWRLPTVTERSGLGKTEVYRRMKDSDPEANPFPPSYAYKRGAGGRVYWVSADVRAWQLAELGLAPPPYPDWPSKQASVVQPVTPAPLGLLG